MITNINKEKITQLRSYVENLRTTTDFEIFIHDRPWEAITISDKLNEEQLDYCVRKEPLRALQYCANKLSDEQRDYCVSSPQHALAYCPNKLSPELFDNYISQWPDIALKYCSDKLNDAQFEFCSDEFPYLALDICEERASKILGGNNKNRVAWCEALPPLS